MLSKSDLDKIISSSIMEVIKDNDINFKDYFIGPNSSFESIDIVQIISSIEDALESINIEGYDLFDSVFKFDELTFSELSDLIEKDLININHDNNISIALHTF